MMSTEQADRIQEWLKTAELKDGMFIPVVNGRTVWLTYDQSPKWVSCVIYKAGPATADKSCLAVPCVWIGDETEEDAKSKVHEAVWTLTAVVNPPPLPELVAQ